MTGDMRARTRVSVFLVLLALACGCSSDAERRAREAQAEAERRIEEAKAEAEHRIEEAKAAAERKAREWSPVLLKTVQEVKADLDKVHQSKTEYDLVVAAPEEGSERLEAHEKRMAGMDRIRIDDLTVGYEQRDDKSLAGTRYERHFRATWVKDGKVVGVSYYSTKEIDGVAFAALLKRVVPIVNEHVSIEKGR